MATETIMPPVHPGEILLEEFLDPLSVSQYQLAKDISVPATADQRDRARPAPHQRGHRAAPGPLLRYLGAVLDEPAGPLRPGN